jgi:hypothetical protein
MGPITGIIFALPIKAALIVSWIVGEVRAEHRSTAPARSETDDRDDRPLRAAA